MPSRGDRKADLCERRLTWPAETVSLHRLQRPLLGERHRGSWNSRLSASQTTPRRLRIGPLSRRFSASGADLEETSATSRRCDASRPLGGAAPRPSQVCPVAGVLRTDGRGRSTRDPGPDRYTPGGLHETSVTVGSRRPQRIRPLVATGDASRVSKSQCKLWSQTAAVLLESVASGFVLVQHRLPK